MTKGMKGLLALIMAAAVCVMAVLGGRLLSDSRLLRQKKEELAVSRAAWEGIAAEKEALQEELEEAENALREARLTLEEATAQAEKLKGQIETLKEETEELKKPESP